jgi:Cd2+/Zn2+-exporting ATPase
VPVERPPAKVAAGATSVDRLVQLTVISEPGDSAIDRILKLIEEAEERRAPIERFIDRFSRIYTPPLWLPCWSPLSRRCSLPRLAAVDL